MRGRRPKPGQIEFGGNTVVGVLRVDISSTQNQISNRPKTPYVIFCNGRVAPGSQPFDAYSPDQATSRYPIARQVILRGKLEAIPLGELKGPIRRGMTIAQAKGAQRRAPENAVSWIVFNGHLQVCDYDRRRFRRVAIEAVSGPQAVQGFKHKRGVDPGSQGYAMRVSDLIGNRDIDPDEFCRRIRPGMTENQLRGISEPGRPRRTNP